MSTSICKCDDGGRARRARSGGLDSAESLQCVFAYKFNEEFFSHVTFNSAILLLPQGTKSILFRLHPLFKLGLDFAVLSTATRAPV